jgi:UDP-N-acetylglucosamine acyltransferase
VGIKRAGLQASLPLLKKAFRLLYRSGIPLQEALDKLQIFADDAQVNHLYQFLKASLTSHRRGVTAGRKRLGETSK